MPAHSLLSVWSLVASAAALKLSPGCSTASFRGARAAPDSGNSSFLKKDLVVADFESVHRTYLVQEPPRPNEPAPFLITFHGQTEDASDYGNWHKFSSLGADQNLMVAVLQGMNDSFPGEEQGTGWNVGSASDNSTCIPQGVGDYYGCYKSCRALKKCGRCNWSTCYNDVLFVQTLLTAIGNEYCIDLDRVYAQGASNGAMMVQHLVRALPNTFAAVSAWYGTPLIGHLLGQQQQLVHDQAALSRTAYLALHGRNDTTIPPSGGVSDGGWIFEPLVQSTAAWAALHRCDDVPTPLATRWDGGDKNFRCEEYMACASLRRVVQCMYDGQHGDEPTGTDGDQATLWFMFQFERSSDAGPPGGIQLV